MPAISVVMAVRNGMPYLPEAVASILNQSWQDFEFIVIDDASSDGSLKMLGQIDDVRLRIIRNRQGLGLAKSLNLGIEASQGEFVARMDSDDISRPKRIEKQYELMQANATLDICGTWAKTIGEAPSQLWQYPTLDQQIKAEMIFASVLVHSSVMMRKASILKHNIYYDENLTAAQDYELWVRIMDKVSFGNIGEALLDYRLHPGQVGRTSGGAQQKVADQVRAGLINKLGISPNKKEIVLHHVLARWDFGESLNELRAIESWLKKLLKSNSNTKLFDSQIFAERIEERWWLACKAHAINGLAAWQTYWQSDLRQFRKRKANELASFYAKSALSTFGIRR